MWKENLIDLRKSTGTSFKDIENGTGIGERTVARIFSKKAEDNKRGHSMDNIVAIVKYLGGSLDDIFADTGAIVGGKNYVEMQEKITALNKQVEVLESDKNLLIADNNLLKSEVATLSGRLELSETRVMYMEKIIAMYERFGEKKD
jgi:transcriptional regulator with XRE-family HTH domain